MFLRTSRGQIAVSPPLKGDYDEMERALAITGANLTYADALARADKAQSIGVRRTQLRGRASLRASADAGALAAAMSGDPALAAAAASAEAPELPNAQPLEAVGSFRDSALAVGSIGDVAPALRPSLQTARNNMMFQRVLDAQTKFLQKQEGYSYYYVYNTISVMPGSLVREDSMARVTLVWSLPEKKNNESYHWWDEIAPSWLYGSRTKIKEREGAASSDLIAVPIYPTFEAANQVDDAALMQEISLLLAATIQYGPAQASPEIAALLNDVRRVISARHQTTVIGTPISHREIEYQFYGLRTAQTDTMFGGVQSKVLEPITIPAITLLMVKSDAFKEIEGSGAKEFEPVNVQMNHEARWERDLAWYQLPLWLFPVDFFSRAYKPARPKRNYERERTEWVLDDINIERNGYVLELPKPSTTQGPKEFTFVDDAPATVTATPEGTNVIVQGNGSIALGFFLDGLAIPFEVVEGGTVSSRNTPGVSAPMWASPGKTATSITPITTYVLKLSPSTLRAIRWSYPGKESAGSTAARQVPLHLRAINPFGLAAKTKLVTIHFPAESEDPGPTVLTLSAGDTTRTITVPRELLVPGSVPAVFQALDEHPPSTQIDLK